MQAAVLQALAVIPNILRLGFVGAILCRIEGLKTKVCKRLALIIALCFLFSLIPVAGLDLDPEASKAAVNVQVESMISSGQLISERVVLAPAELISAKETVLQHDLGVQKAGALHRLSARKVLHRLSKPDQDEICLTEDRRASRTQGVRVVGQKVDALLKQTVRADPIGFLLKVLISSYHFTRTQRFQHYEQIEGELMQTQTAVTHGLVRVKANELTKAAYTYDGYSQNHQRALSEGGRDSAASSALLRGRAGMIWLKEAPKDAGQGLSKTSGSHFGLGLTREQEQIHNVVAALRRSGLFAAVAGTIEEMNLFMLPQFATIFVPTDSAYRALKQEDINFQLFQYHIVMQRYAFSQLCSLREGDILYTLLPGFSIIVTAKQSPFKIYLDGVSLIAPDLYMDQSIAVHGIDGIFNCTMYGKNFGAWHVPEGASPPAANASDKQGPANVSTPAVGPDASLTNGSVVGPGDASQAGPVQQTVPASSSFPLSFSPAASEFTSDTDAADDTRSANLGACTSATAFVCALSLLLF